MTWSVGPLVGRNKRRQALHECTCSCGRVWVRTLDSIKRELSTRCAACCGRSPTTPAPRSGASKHPLYSSWKQMRARCRNPNHEAYANYGGRGISVCHKWDTDFWAFVADVGPRPDGTTLDRKNNDGDYEPGNVRWATKSEQALNRRNHWLALSPDCVIPTCSFPRAGVR